MKRLLPVVGLLALLSGLLGPGVPKADDTTKPAEKPSAAKKTSADKADDALFLRIVRDAAKTPTALETSVVRYIGKTGKYAGRTVDLIGAVHVGDKSYYRELNKRFATYEALLYELVAPKGTRIPKGGRSGGSGHPVGMLQNGMTDVLGLAHQLEEVDYTKKNFVHADMSPKEFSEKMAERGESWTGMFFKMMGQGMAMQAGKGAGGSAEFGMLAAMFSSNRELALKRAMADQFEDMDVMMAAFEGEEGSTIITERNKAALKVLADELKAGKKMIGIFYGAGHLPDMDERLRKEFGLEREGHEWLTAWSMTDADAKNNAVKKPQADEAKPAQKPAAKPLRKPAKP